MIKDVVSKIALSDYITFLVDGVELQSCVLFQLKREPDKYVMLGRYKNGKDYIYKVHTFNSSFEEINCEEFDNIFDFSKSLVPSNMVYSFMANDLVLDIAKKLISHLKCAYIKNNDFDEKEIG